MTAKNEHIKKLAAAIQANPSDSFSKFALALEFIKMEKLQKARILFEDIHHKDPDYTGVYYHLGKLYEQLDETEKAVEIYEEGIRKASDQKKTRTLSELQNALSALTM